MNTHVHDIEQAILRMTRVLQGSADVDLGAEWPGGGWWVLAVGDPLQGKDFDEREEARERLRACLESAGISLPEHVWVWDETELAQLVVATLPSRERADKLARRLRKKGLVTRVVREMDDDAEL